MIKDAYFAGGCFWCITPVFAELSGVTGVICGYSGGSEQNADYNSVKHQLTGHRETLKVSYDAGKVSYRELLALFLSSVDPFDADGQFIDRGHSYTLAIYYGDRDEFDAAFEALDNLSAISGRAPAVSLEPFNFFCIAEDYHQNYYLNNPDAFAKELEESGRNSYFSK